MSYTQKGKLENYQNVPAQLEIDNTEKNVVILDETLSSRNSSKNRSKDANKPLYLDRV